MTPNRKRLVAGGVVVVIAAVVVLSIVAGRRGGGAPVAATTSATATSSSSAATSSPTSSARPSSATAAPTASPTSPAPTAPSSSAPVPPSSAAPALAPVGVVVTVASWNSLNSDVEFGAFVQGVVETGGTCVVTMSKGSQQATGRAAALPNAKNTSCGDLRVAGSAVSTGSWTATVTYASPTSSGASAPTTVEVP